MRYPPFEIKLMHYTLQKLQLQLNFQVFTTRMAVEHKCIQGQLMVMLRDHRVVLALTKIIQTKVQANLFGMVN